MEADPPYLFSLREELGSGVSVVRDPEAAVIEVTIRGRWNRQLCLDVYVAMRKFLTEHPAAIIVDLRELSDVDAASVNMWSAAARVANALQPPVQLALSMPPTRQLASRLRRLGAVRFLPIFVTMQQARAAVASQTPLTDSLHFHRLRPEPAAVDAAGGLVTVACEAWDLPRLVEPSRHVMSELVTNAVRHAATEMTVTVSRRGNGIYLAVHDGDPRPPRLLNPTADTPGTGARTPGEGLRTVHAQAYVWGAVPTDQGKVVWAIIRSTRSAPQ